MCHVWRSHFRSGSGVGWDSKIGKSEILMMFAAKDSHFSERVEIQELCAKSGGEEFSGYCEGISIAN